MDLFSWLNIANGQFTTSLMIFTRFSALLFAAPLLGGKIVPSPIRLGLSAMLAATLTPLFPPLIIEGPAILVVCLTKEALIGLLLGWIGGLFLACVQMAGEWLDLQSGFEAAHVLNPAYGEHTALLSSFCNVLGGLIFFSTGGHILMIRAAARSLTVSPPGLLSLHLGGAADWTGLLGQVLWIAVQLAAPVAAALFLSEIGIGLIHRAMPQVNAMILTLPAKAALALVALALSAPVLIFGMGIAFERLGEALSRVVQAMGG